jgi:anti-sigma regulatory factor (Ser/Thr protein kinase)
VVEDAVLLVSELASNAVQHAHTEFEVYARWCASRLLVAVIDTAPFRYRGRPDPTADGGRGLELVALLSSSWGVYQDGDVKAVWFELGSPTARPG